MSGISLLQQPAVPRSRECLSARFWQLGQPGPDALFTTDQGVVVIEAKASLSNIPVTPTSALTPREPTYFAGKFGEPVAINAVTYQTVDEDLWARLAGQIIGPSLLTPLDESYFSEKLSASIAFNIDNVPASDEINWAKADIRLAGESFLTPSRENYLSKKFCKSTAFSYNNLALIDAGWKTFNIKTTQQSVLSSLESAFVIERRKEVLSFVEENQLSGILMQARDPLRKAFGAAAVKTLTLVEDDEGSLTLFCLVMIPGDMQEARASLRSFDRGWWLHHSKKVSGRLNFDFELI